MSNTPKDPFGPLMEVATQLHELMMAFIEAGFNRDEALTLIRDVIRQGQELQ